jgi:hypothetical protein
LIKLTALKLTFLIASILQKMARFSRIIHSDQPHYVIQRGNNRQDIFLGIKGSDQFDFGKLVFS